MFEYLLKGKDVFAVLPTGFGKSLLFQLLPDIFPVKADKNIVIVVGPLNSIIEDQLKVLQDRGITADVLQLFNDEREATESLFNSDESKADGSLKNPSAKLMNGDIQIMFKHPEALLSKGERFKKENILDVRSHFKPTEIFQYTHYSSCHPPGVSKGFIKGEALRLLRTNSSKTTFEENIRSFRVRLRMRGYPRNLVDLILSEVKFTETESRLYSRGKRRKISHCPLSRNITLSA